MKIKLEDIDPNSVDGTLRVSMVLNGQKLLYHVDAGLMIRHLQNPDSEDMGRAVILGMRPVSD